MSLYKILLILFLIIGCDSVCNEFIFYGARDQNSCIQSNQHLLLCHNSVGMSCSCTNDCTDVNGLCMNSTISKPSIELIYPKTCTTQNMLPDVECNYYSNGTICPLGCLNYGNSCNSTRPDIICKPYSDWSCPYGCNFDKHTNSCIPIGPQNVCTFIEKTLTCPSRCPYNNYLKKCISSDPNFICGLERKLICPSRCNLNVRGDICIGGDKTICDRINVPLCPTNCYYEKQEHICKRTSNFDPFNRYTNTIWEPVIIITCPYDAYTVDTQHYLNCNTNSSDICITSNTIIQYPVRLQNKYSGILCKYSTGNCETKKLVRICCNP